jgi:guanylate kinase
MKPVIVNFFSGPGAGKSTTAAALFAELKWNKISCEFVQEYAKDKVWEGSFNVLKNQFYISAKQHHRLFNLSNKVDVIVTDSPLLMGIFYGNDDEKLNSLIKQEFFKFDNLNYFIERDESYETKGRLQSFEEAIEIDTKIFNFLEQNRILFKKIKSDKNTVKDILKEIKNKLNNSLLNGKVLVITGPSGAGKTTLANALMDTSKIFEKCITTTTRSPRQGEIDGKDYNFINVETFSDMLKKDCFFEWEEVYSGIYYGSSYTELKKIWDSNKLPVLVTDVKGALKIKKIFEDKCYSVYLDVTFEQMEKRLRDRVEQKEEEIIKRINRYKLEDSMKQEFDLILEQNDIQILKTQFFKAFNGKQKIDFIKTF